MAGTVIRYVPVPDWPRWGNGTTRATSRYPYDPRDRRSLVVTLPSFSSEEPACDHLFGNAAR